MKLPEEYAAFLREGGPVEGGMLLTRKQARAYGESDAPFPFTLDDVKRVLAARAKGEDAFLEPKDTVGSALVIADRGCNDLTCLVLRGPLRGSVWASTEAGWLPHARSDGTLMGFREWYAAFADEPEGKPKTKRAAKRPDVTDRNAYQLNFRDRGLAALPDEVAEMTAVAMVYLGGNAFTDVPPPLLRVAEKLLSLELGPNPLASLGDIEGFTRLTMLDLKRTKITKLPESLSAVPLRELNLHGNAQLDIEQALEVAARIPTLRVLFLGECGLAKLPRALSKLTQLERLYLADNELDALPDLELELLAVQNNRIEKIPDEVEARVQNLYFSGNPGTKAEKKRFDAIRKSFVMLG